MNGPYAERHKELQSAKKSKKELKIAQKAIKSPKIKNKKGQNKPK